jgi:hypothetical protein
MQRVAMPAPMASVRFRFIILAVPVHVVGAPAR